MSHRESEYQSYQADLKAHEDSVIEAVEDLKDEFKSMGNPSVFDLYAEKSHEGEFTSIESACNHLANHHEIGTRWRIE